MKKKIDQRPMLISKMEHADLVIEMAQVEHLSTQDRLHLARMYVLICNLHIFLTVFMEIFCLLF